MTPAAAATLKGLRSLELPDGIERRVRIHADGRPDFSALSDGEFDVLLRAVRRRRARGQSVPSRARVGEAAATLSEQAGLISYPRSGSHRPFEGAIADSTRWTVLSPARLAAAFSASFCTTLSRTSIFSRMAVGDRAPALVVIQKPSC